MDLHYLKVFNTVAECLSFKKASEVLHVSQPALSIQMKKLEAQTNLKLYYKIGNQIYLSESGTMLYEYTKKIFTIVDDMERTILSQNVNISGNINLGGSNTPGAYILPTVIGKMKEKYPAVTINLHIANTSEITALINNGTLDIAVNGGDYEYGPSVNCEKLIDDRLVIVASPNSKLFNKKNIRVSDFTDESFIVHETTSQLYTSSRILMEEYGIPENISMYLGSIEAIKNAVTSNLGITIMPYYAVEFELKRKILREVDIGRGKFPYPYNLIYHKNKDLTLTTKKFIEILKKTCEEIKEQ